MTPQFRGVEGDLGGLAVGGQIHPANCACCHGFDGQGTRDQYYPSLYHNSATSDLLQTVRLLMAIGATLVVALVGVLLVRRQRRHPA